MLIIRFSEYLNNMVSMNGNFKYYLLIDFLSNKLMANLPLKIDGRYYLRVDYWNTIYYF